MPALPTFDQLVAERASTQAGLLSRRDVFDLGGTDRMIAARLRSGRWRRVAVGVYLIAGTPSHPHRRLWIAHLDAGRRSVISHQSAAALHGLSGYTLDPVTVTAPHPYHARSSTATVHQLTDLDRRHVGRFGRLPVTTPPRTIVDLAAIVSRGRLLRAAEDAAVERPSILPAVARLTLSLARPGKPGMRAMISVLDELIDGDPPPQSVLEHLGRTIIDMAGITAARRQRPLPGWDGGSAAIVDFEIEDAWLIVEFDGRRFHQRLEQAARDRRRDQAAAGAGRQVVRFGFEEVTDAADTAARLGRIYRARLRLLGRMVDETGRRAG